jgi:hypothetical protein
MSRGRRGGGNRGCGDVTVSSHVELVPQATRGARHAHLRRGLAAPDDRRDLVVRPLGDEAEEEELAVVRRQPVESAAEHGVARRVLMSSRLGGQHAPPTPAQLVRDASLCHREQPRPHRMRCRSACESSGGVHERLLRQLLGVVPVVQPAEDERVDVAAKACEGVLESR